MYPVHQCACITIFSECITLWGRTAASPGASNPNSKNLPVWVDLQECSLSFCWLSLNEDKKGVASINKLFGFVINISASESKKWEGKYVMKICCYANNNSYEPDNLVDVRNLTPTLSLLLSTVLKRINCKPMTSTMIDHVLSFKNSHQLHSGQVEQIFEQSILWLFLRVPTSQSTISLIKGYYTFLRQVF